MTDQEIRAKALELTISAMALSATGLSGMLDAFKKSGEDHITYPFIYHSERFEKYIRSGEKIK